MDDDRFDAWTRRRLGLTASGVLAALASLGGVNTDTAAKPKHKPKPRKCKKPETRCKNKNTCVKGECCPGEPCGPKSRDCQCGKTIEDKPFCFEPIVAICEQCVSDDDCIESFRCVKTKGCQTEVTAICLPPCGTLP